MDEAEAAQLEGATPAGLANLGNTCYMNSTLQALRSITELEEELFRYGRDEYALSQIHHYHNGRLTVRQCHRRRWAV
jgi:ubiquitin carboxyl-terminal hydrolase 14